MKRFGHGISQQTCDGPTAVKSTRVGICVLLLTGLSSTGAAAPGRRAATTGPGVVLTALGGRIVAANADGSGIKQLTRPPTDVEDAHPVASPDGSQIAFDRGFDSVYVMNGDGSGLHLVGPGTEPHWSPDGKWLAFEGDLYSDDVVTYVARPDGTARRRVIRAAAYGISWSPDGRSIAYPGGGGIASVNVYTGGRGMLVRKDDAWRPSWSPDGRRIAFLAGDPSRMYVASIGERPRPVGVVTEAQTASWSPDGTRLTYGVGASARRVAVIDVASGRTTSVVAPIVGSVEAHAVWSPDGGEIAFTRGSVLNELEGGDVWTMDADGKNLHRATTPFPLGEADSPASWWPGRNAITPDPSIATVAFRPVGSLKLGHEPYLSFAVDGSTVGLVPYHVVTDARELGLWNGRGRVVWTRAGTGFDCVDWLALAGRRGYWTCNETHLSYSEASLWTARLPRGKPRRLRGVIGDSPRPWFALAGNRSLVVYSSHRILWRVRGTASKVIRREDVDVRPLDVADGRVLLARADGTLELVKANGRLLKSFARPAGDVRSGALSGDRVVAAGADRIWVFDARSGRLRASWPVGAPGLRAIAGRMYGPLLPYAEGPAVHVLDVDTGREIVLQLPRATAPVTGAMTRDGLIYTWAATYSRGVARVGRIPLAELTRAVAQAAPTHSP